MADNATIFNGGTSTEGTKNETTQQPTKPEGSVLVGEGRKYKDFSELEKAYMHLDDFAETLKAENNTLRASKKEAATVDEVLERLKAVQSTSQDRQLGDRDEQPLSVGDVAKIVKQTVTGLKTEEQKAANLQKADALMKAAFGEKAAEIYSSKANSPELHKVYMELASVNPDQFAELFGATKTPQSTSQADRSTVNTSAGYTPHQDRSGTPGTQEYYAKMRRERPDVYYSHATQLEMDAAVRSNRDNFYGTKR